MTSGSSFLSHFSVSRTVARSSGYEMRHEPSWSMCLKSANHAVPELQTSSPLWMLCSRNRLSCSERACTSSAVAAATCLIFLLNSSPIFCSSLCFSSSASRRFFSLDACVRLRVG